MNFFQTVLFLKTMKVSDNTYCLFLSALTAAALTVQEEAAKTDADTEEDEDEEDVRQTAEDDQSEEAEGEETCEW